jgi:hypothetical protein
MSTLRLSTTIERMKKLTFNRNGAAKQLAEKLCMKKGDLHLLIGCSRSYIHHADTKKRSMGNKFSTRLQNLILPVFQQEAKAEKKKSKTSSNLSIELTPAHQKKIENKLQDLKLTLQTLERRNARFNERKSSLTQAITLTEKLSAPDASDIKHTALFESWKTLHLRELNQQLKKFDTLEFHQMQIRKLQLQTEIEYWKKL